MDLFHNSEHDLRGYAMVVDGLLPRAESYVSLCFKRDRAELSASFVNMTAREARALAAELTTAADRADAKNAERSAAVVASILPEAA